MKKSFIFIITCFLCSPSKELQAQFGANAASAAGRAAAYSATQAMNQEYMKSIRDPYSAKSQNSTRSFIPSKQDLDFWYGDPVLIKYPVDRNNGFGLIIALTTAKANYNTWKLVVGPHVDASEYENRRQELGAVKLSKADTFQVFRNMLTDQKSFDKFQRSFYPKNSPKPLSPSHSPTYFKKLPTNSSPWLYFFLFLYWVISTIGIWNIFYKADCRPKGYAFIPFWRITGLCRVVGLRSNAALWMLVPGLNIAFWVWLHIRLCKKFGVPSWLGFLALGFPPALWWLIGRSSDVWYQP